ncbi:MAG: penicillin-binding protein 2 [Chloroflexaceae bacterium]|nr:penicillin-binding protein 2 [Chloroflexaceae bacterium]NJO04339.1 penicillin-binding protein 2 [Chloroflexaceae bacterium]
MASRTTSQPGIAARSAPRRSVAASGPVRLSRWRIYTLLLVACVGIGAVMVRLYYVQVVKSSAYAQLASREIEQQITLNPNRGVITDRHGNVLALDIERESLWVVPALIPEDSRQQLAITLAAMLGLDQAYVLWALTPEDNVYWRRVARWLEPKHAERIAALGQPGLRLIAEPMRYYPQNEFAGHLVGAVNSVGDGISGVESFFNDELKGITGTIQAEFDAARNPIAIAPQRTTPARDGENIRLTIDPMIQYIAETELQRAVEQHNADGGSVIIMEIETGAIRGMASWPTFDPNRWNEYVPDQWRNPATSSVYEPGSTFKMVTVAAGLQARAFTADTLVNDIGTVFRYDTALSNWNHAGNGMINAEGVLYHSSNVGALLLNELTGPENFYRTVRALGFGAPSGIEIGGEEAGIVHDSASPLYNDILLATNAYGQGISATPLQMTAMAAVVANDGVLMRPYLVEERCDGDACIVTEPHERGQAIDPEVAWTLRRMLVKSANHYAPVVWAGQTGSYADQWLVPGFQVGAKTGTASIPLPGGGYDPSFTIGSVLGFAPAENARYAVLAKVDRPKDDIWGVQTAIPLFYNVVDQLLRHERLSPDPSLVSPGQ